MKTIEKIKKTEAAHETDEVERYWPQIFAILVGALSGFTDGVNIAWPSPYIVVITQDKDNYNISEEQASYFNTFHAVGFLIGCPIFGVLCDKIGRKKTYYSTAILHILGLLFAAFAKDIYLFYLSRICAGLANACFFAVFPTYVGEIANPTVRGSWGNAVASSMYLGELAINVIGSYVNVPTASYICLPLPMIFLVLFYAIPESPYYLIMKGREAEAKKSLIYFTRKENVEKDYIKLKEDVDRQLSESGSWVDLFKIKSNRRAVLAGTFLRFTQQTSGLGIFCFFTQSVFQKAGTNIGHQLASVIFMAVNMVLNIIVLLFIVHRFSRKKLYIASLASSGIVLYLLGTFFYADSHLNVDLSAVRWMPITGMISYLVCASYGLCVIPSLMMSELFSASIKGKAMAFLLIFMSLGNILINTSFYYLIEYLGFHSPFYLYAVANTIATVMSFYIIPETKGKTLEEIQQMLKQKKMKD
ncbi:unnamed protein product [Psylliodes chrysocephalus]|uniref:Major facilitator superfamily (MFS) profile domain-containing protein n=1 Tax=Psylliodes chrysocephalus TaxID=3402493 RepID=A0A9P0CM57_9CUCU|nr:unnamed protein product [Psylliodes chrysocephala]